MRDVAAGKTAIDIKTKKFGRAMVEGGKGNGDPHRRLARAGYFHSPSRDSFGRKIPSVV